AAGRLTNTYFGTGATTLGAAGGGQSVTLVTGNLPAYTPTGFNGASAVTASTHTLGYAALDASAQGGGAVPAGFSLGTWTGTAAAQIFTGNAQGGSSTPFSQVQPTMLATVYLKL
ncbi:MAG TPA: hypothetical protein VH187_01210, partial [Scandinavium sp.]|uniref:hypothetical protein n=1 Tax=Scandinavium sp. TaxID=2830653 RepID=UPI002E3008AB